MTLTRILLSAPGYSFSSRASQRWSNLDTKGSSKSTIWKPETLAPPYWILDRSPSTKPWKSQRKDQLLLPMEQMGQTSGKTYITPFLLLLLLRMAAEKTSTSCYVSVFRDLGSQQCQVSKKNIHIYMVHYSSTYWVNKWDLTLLLMCTSVYIYLARYTFVCGHYLCEHCTCWLLLWKVVYCLVYLICIVLGMLYTFLTGPGSRDTFHHYSESLVACKPKTVLWTETHFIAVLEFDSKMRQDTF